MAKERRPRFQSARLPAGLSDASIRLRRYTLTVLPGGHLEAMLFADDEAAFLARLLRQVSLLSLFPTEFEINTRQGRIEDRFVFCAIGGRAPGRPVAAALDQMFARTIQPA